MEPTLPRSSLTHPNPQVVGGNTVPSDAVYFNTANCAAARRSIVALFDMARDAGLLARGFDASSTTCSALEIKTCGAFVSEEAALTFMADTNFLIGEPSECMMHLLATQLTSPHSGARAHALLPFAPGDPWFAPNRMPSRFVSTPPATLANPYPCRTSHGLRLTLAGYTNF